MRKNSTNAYRFAIGAKFGRLKIIGPPFRVHAGNVIWKGAKYFYVCECDCGNFTAQNRSNLLGGKVSSCGCWLIEFARRIGSNQRRHGESGTNLHNLWHLMRIRCYGKNQPHYHIYGGRGISVCKEWNDSYETFMDWANENGYQHGLQIDRINNNGNYEPTNCRFVTSKQNNRNRRSNVVAEWNGERKTLIEWSEDCRCVVSYNALLIRYTRYKWKLEHAITVSEIPRSQRLSFDHSVYQR